MEALLDAGFDGDIAVPPDLVTNGEIPDEYLIWTLADGSEVLAPAFLGTARLSIRAFSPTQFIKTVLPHHADEPPEGHK